MECSLHQETDTHSFHIRNVDADARAIEAFLPIRRQAELCLASLLLWVGLYLPAFMQDLQQFGTIQRSQVLAWAVLAPLVVLFFPVLRSGNRLASAVFVAAMISMVVALVILQLLRIGSTYIALLLKMSVQNVVLYALANLILLVALLWFLLASIRAAWYSWHNKEISLSPAVGTGTTFRGRARTISQRAGLPPQTPDLGWFSICAVLAFSSASVYSAQVLLSQLVNGANAIRGSFEWIARGVKEKCAGIKLKHIDACLNEWLPTALLSSFGYAFASILILVIVYNICEYGVRRASVIDMSALKRRDDRSHNLLLRSFRQDEKSVPTAFQFAFSWCLLAGRVLGRPVEEIVFEEASHNGPVVAIGEPATMRRPFGAARAFVSHDAWRQEIERLMLSSNQIYVILDDSAGVLWEVAKIVELNLLHRTFFIFGRDVAQQEFLNKLHALLPINCIPSSSQIGLNAIIGFALWSGRTEYFVSHNQSDLAIVAALRILIKENQLSYQSHASEQVKCERFC
jgi:hypothetical protein